MTQHKWHKEIKAWADGAEIEYRKIGTDKWGKENTTNDIYWDSTVFEYRIKPQPKETQYLYMYLEPETGNYKFSKLKLKIYEEFYIGKIKLEMED